VAASREMKLVLVNASGARRIYSHGWPGSHEYHGSNAHKKTKPPESAWPSSEARRRLREHSKIDALRELRNSDWIACPLDDIRCRRERPTNGRHGRRRRAFQGSKLALSDSFKRLPAERRILQFNSREHSSFWISRGVSGPREWLG
jgi:hypothetical protein